MFRHAPGVRSGRRDSDIAALFRRLKLALRAHVVLSNREASEGGDRKDYAGQHCCFGFSRNCAREVLEGWKVDRS